MPFLRSRAFEWLHLVLKSVSYISPSLQQLLRPTLPGPQLSGNDTILGKTLWEKNTFTAAVSWPYKQVLGWAGFPCFTSFHKTWGLMLLVGFFFPGLRLTWKWKYACKKVFTSAASVLSPHLLVWASGSLLKACFLGFFPKKHMMCVWNRKRRWQGEERRQS